MPCHRDPACPGAQYAASSSAWSYFDVKAAARASAAARDFGPSFCAPGDQPGGRVVREGGAAGDALAGTGAPDVLIGGPGNDTRHLGGHTKRSRDKHPGCERVVP